MSGGGAISSMVTSIRNNRRDRKSKLEKLKNTSNNREDFIDYKKASPELLRKIRTRLQEDNKVKNKKAIIKTSVILILIFIIIYIFNKNWQAILNSTN
ncbi:hypothetical protein [uncultured Flavobacterium sp.]|uniref:hypothetical protein n=1 Tax=uncultured Flavobacterium sp. TaxID=165435 RepID=UPI0030EE7261|tara:strand:- start:61936 stop:62229 length:294 start_codon:yes stop_codon:yes gene_type:complete